MTLEKNRIFVGITPKSQQANLKLELKKVLQLMKRPRMAFEDISEVEPQNLHENFDLEFWRNLFEGCAGVISHHKPKQYP